MSAALPRTLLLERAFLDAPRAFLGRQLRPITILSLELCHQLGLPLIGKVDVLARLDVSTLTERVAIFVFVHSEPWDAVVNAVWNDEVPSFDDLQDAPQVCSAFLGMLREFNALVEAASFEPRLRKGYERETPPEDLAPTSWLADMVDEIAARYHWSEHFILRVLPFVRAVQYHHQCTAARAHLWTTLPGKAVSAQMHGLEAVTTTLASLARTDDEV